MARMKTINFLEKLNYKKLFQPWVTKKKNISRQNTFIKDVHKNICKSIIMIDFITSIFT